MLGITQKNSPHSRVGQGKQTILDNDKHRELTILGKFYYETVIFKPNMLDLLATRASTKTLQWEPTTLLEKQIQQILFATQNHFSKSSKR